MGCDIHTIVEVKTPDGWKAVPLELEIFAWRSYRLFGFLANVRNYSHSPSIAPYRGWPDDCSSDALELRDQWELDGHSATSITLAELLAYDYSQVFEDRRTTHTTVFPGGGTYINGAALAAAGEGKQTAMRDFLGEAFFEELDRLRGLGPAAGVRVLMIFDN